MGLKTLLRGRLADFGRGGKKIFKKQFFLPCLTVKSEISCYPVIVNFVFAKLRCAIKENVRSNGVFIREKFQE